MTSAENRSSGFGSKKLNSEIVMVAIGVPTMAVLLDTVRVSPLLFDGVEFPRAQQQLSRAEARSVKTAALIVFARNTS